MRIARWKLTIGGTALGLLTACNRQEPTLDHAPTPVRVVAVEMFTPSTGERYSASVFPDRQVTLTFKTSGFVTSLYQVRGANDQIRNVEIGDVIPAGTVLGQLRVQDTQIQIDQINSQIQQARQATQTARAQLVQVQAAAMKASQDFDRAQALFGAKALIKPDYDAAKAQYDATRAQVEAATSQIASSEAAVKTAEIGLENANLNLRDMSLTNPFSGVLVQRNVEVGTFVTPGLPAFVLADLASVRVTFGVPDTVLVSMKPGTRLGITAEALPTRRFEGAISYIAAVADPSTRLFQIQANIPNQNGLLRPGMIATVALGRSVRTEPVPVVPLSAIVRAKDNSGFAVVIVEGKQARRRSVTLGATYDDRVAITGVKPGDQVVASGTALVADGDSVEIVP